MPFDIAPDPPRRDLAQADQLEQLGALGAPAVRARELLVQHQHLVGAQPVREAEQLGEVAERPAEPRRVPLVGRTSPQAIFTSVDLPAPLGPSRPTSSPSPTVRSTPLSASLAP